MKSVLVTLLLGYALNAGMAQAVEHEAEAFKPMVSNTGKERLGEKATDEQRVNDCKVAPGRRGVARPTACPWDMPS